MTCEQTVTLEQFNLQAIKAHDMLSLAIAPTQESWGELDIFSQAALSLYTDTMLEWKELCLDQSADPTDLREHAIRVRNYTQFAQEALNSLNPRL